MLGITDIKTGKNIVLEGEPFVVLEYSHSKVGRAGAVLRTKLKNLISGAVIDKTFQGVDKVEEADMSRTKAQFLYAEGSDYHFMDNESFEQFAIAKDVLSDALNYLTEGLEVTLLSFNDTPVNIALPVKVELEVTEAPPGLKGDTQSGGDKLVTVETGHTVTTPLFVETGDKIVVNTEKGNYVSKVQ